MPELFIAVWSLNDHWKISEFMGKPVRECGAEVDHYYSESELLRECEDRERKPEIVTHIVKLNGKWSQDAYELDLDQARRDAMADAWMQKPRFGT